MKTSSLPVFFVAALALASAAGPACWAAALEQSKIYIEYNQSANDLGFHVSLDGEDWRNLKIVNPDGKTIFEVKGKQAYKELGMTELFFEGAEPSLDDVPLDDLLARFPEGDYKFSGKTVDGEEIEGTGTLSYAIPNGPGNVSATLGANDSLVISWDAVTSPPNGFPDKPISIVGYQVIVDPFQVTVPGTTISVTVSPEFVSSLAAGEHPCEVLAIDASGNQTITESSFVKP
jgi:hypothetical protein